MISNDRVLQALRAANPTTHGMGGSDAPPADLLRAILVTPVAMPRRHQLRLPRMLLVVPPALAVLLVIVLVASAVLRPSSVFATWTAIPTPVDPAFAGAMQHNCMVPPDDPTFDPELREQLRAFADLPLVVIDQRGRAAVALFAQRRANAVTNVMCLTISSEPGGAPVAGGGNSAISARENPPNGPLRLFSAGRNSSEAGTYTTYAGFVDPAVTRVGVERDQGGGVTATVSNGYFLAWWPGEAHATRLVAYGAAGQVVAEIDNHGWDFADWQDCPNQGTACGGGY